MTDRRVLTAKGGSSTRPLAEPCDARRIGKPKVTVLIPAYNEAPSIGETIRSLQCQTFPIHEIVVIDDFSDDGTGDVARALDVTVIRPPHNTGSKAGAQNYALSFVSSSLTMAIDADTTLAPDAVEKLVVAFEDPLVAAACGFVLPRRVSTVWERGRYIEYLFAFSFFKSIQDFYTKPLISSGCFSLYRTDILKQNGGWQRRTLAEDMDLTWSYYARNLRVRFLPEAQSYPIEPHSFLFMRRQLKRWSHGFIQNVLLHWKDLRGITFLNLAVAVALWDAVVASLFYLILLPVLSLIFMNPLILLGYAVDIPAVLVPTLLMGFKRAEVLRVLASLPAFFVLRTVNSVFMLEAIWSEMVLRRTFRTYEKGH